MLMERTCGVLGDMINSQTFYLEMLKRRHELRNWGEMGGS
jgi:hypothetical protein